MPCYYPITAYLTGDEAVVFVERGDIRSTLQLPCGQCIGCRLTRAAQWTSRVIHEMKATLPLPSYFVTLTYDPLFLPALGSLQYSDVQGMHHRLRKRGCKFRFFLSGEYGDDLERPHYHAVYFGLQLPDLRPSSLLYNAHKQWRSKLLEAVWDKGHVHIGTVTPDSAAYVAGYALKKITGDAAKSHYAVFDSRTGEVLGHKVPEFCRMSLRPGIGATWRDKFAGDYADGSMLSPKMKPVKVPRYYDKLMGREDPEMLDLVKQARVMRAAEIDPVERSAERLHVSAQVARAGVEFYRRRKL